MKKYNVRLYFHTHVDVEVEADNEQDAREEAYCLAGTDEFSSQYRTNSQVDNDPDVEEVCKKPTITKADIAGWRVETDEQTIYFGEYVHLGCNDGVVYKDRHAFETGEGVCYIQEYGFENAEQNSGELFEFAAKEGAASEIVNNPYVATTGYTRKDFEDIVAGTKYSAYNLFYDCEWQSPETLMDEWLQHDDEEMEEEIDDFEDERLTPQQRKELGYE